ncbi:MAG: hypothetical protein EOM91_14125 [Sphingobacteriia bacterium]|nr:hypothetical protein [Sphingobacteriia bacterium]NCC37829.1 hypothetical protein [Gammaproteobacteria bacterium]
MTAFSLLTTQIADIAADSIINRSAEQAALESHLVTLQERLRQLIEVQAPPHALADARLQVARALVGLERGEEAWPIGRAAFDQFIVNDQFELAADVCDVLSQSNQPGAISALGQGIWLAVTCPIDPELTVELLNHVIDETPNHSDGAAVAATTALFIADVRARDRQREDLMFLATQMLGTVARRHSGVDSPEQLDQWMDRLELKEPEKFLVRLRNVVDVLVQDDWWFDREALQKRLPFG